MRKIDKANEPRSLTEYRLAPEADYENYRDKNGLRATLVDEQRGLCCYCMSRIRSDERSMKIEHWQCQKRYPERQLEYRNLLGACLGGKGQQSRLQHCDTRKGELELKWNPAEPTHQIEARIRYDPDGTIRSDDPEFDQQLNDVLNLNLAKFRNNRKAVLDAVCEWWTRRKSQLQSRIPPFEIQRQIDRRIPQTGDLQPFDQVAVWWLRKRL
jgi:uncharacterized protein (TIGR02646 family)